MKLQSCIIVSASALQHDVDGIGYKTAEEIRYAVENEIGLTVSIGVSFSKIFAKLGSDMKKPNAVTVISKDSYKEKVWPLPVSELLYVGPARTKKLALLGCRTIGDLANSDPYLIHQKLGKNGLIQAFCFVLAKHVALFIDFFIPPKYILP